MLSQQLGKTTVVPVYAKPGEGYAGAEPLFDQEALQLYILSACQEKIGEFPMKRGLLGPLRDSSRFLLVFISLVSLERRLAGWEPPHRVYVKLVYLTAYVFNQGVCETSRPRDVTTTIRAIACLVSLSPSTPAAGRAREARHPW